MLRKLQKSQKVNFRAVARSAVRARQFNLSNFDPAVAYATAGLYLVISPNTYNYILNDPLNTFDMSGYGWINDHVNSITKGYKISNNWRIGPRFPKDPPDPKEIPEPKNLDKANPTPPDLENVLRCILVPSQCRSPRKPLHIPCPDNQVPVLPVDVNIPASIFSLPPLHLQLHIDFDIKPPLGPDLRYTL